MKKSKFLLLGSVASLASIPFVAAKCGETKEEKKPEEGKNPGQNTEPGKNPGGDKNPGENTDQDKNPGGDKNPGTDKKPEEEKKPEGDKAPEADKKPEGEKKPEADKPAEKPGGDKNPETDTTHAKSTKIDLSKLESNIQNELSKLAKDGVSPEEVLNVLKEVKGLEKLTLLHFDTVEFKGNKLTVKAIEDSNLITGKYEFTV